jgi:hypothetical protein
MEASSEFESDDEISGSTDRSGRFVAIVRPGQRYWVTADDDLLHGAALVTARAPAVDVEVSLRAPVVQAVRGTVRSMDGRPVAGARVRVGWEDGAHVEGATGADGSFDVALPRPSAHLIEVEISASGFAAASTRFPNRWSGPAHQRVDAILIPIARVRGLVRMRDGGAIPQGTTIAYRLVPERVRRLWAYLADGRFSIDMEKSGEVFVRATGLEVRHTEVSAGRVELGEEREVTLVVDRVPTARVATLDADGRPIERGGQDGRSPGHSRYQVQAWLVPDVDVSGLPTYGGPRAVFRELRRSLLGGTGLPVESDGTVRVPLAFEGERWLLVAANRKGLAPARVRISAARVPSSVRLRRLVAVLDAALDVVGGGSASKIEVAGTWDDGTESGPFTRTLQGHSGRANRIQVLRPDTGRPARITLTLRLPGYPPKQFAAESLAAAVKLPVDTVRFQRE